LEHYRIQYRCAKCHGINQSVLDTKQNALTCAHCGFTVLTKAEVPLESRWDRCLVCPGKELFLRKDFSHSLGLAIVCAGFGASCVTWYYHQLLATYFILFLTAAIDVVLYFLVGDVLECYNCHAIYRGEWRREEHPPFDLEVHERYRQQAARRGLMQVARVSDKEESIR
jgi:DNA-directed RNA polymerase subunit RPC12/RpoP